MNLTRAEHKELLRALRLEEEIPAHLAERAQQHIKNCSKCRLILAEAGQLKKKLKPVLGASHPTADELLAYLTSVDSASHEYTSTSSAESSQKVHDHVQTCKLCRNRVQHLEGEIKQVESIMRNVGKELAFEQDYHTTQSLPFPRSLPHKRKFALPPIPRAILPVVGACAALLLMFFVSLLTQSESYLLANLQTDNLDVLPRYHSKASGEAALVIAEELIGKGDYAEARSVLVDVSAEGMPPNQVLRLQLYDMMLTLKLAHRTFFFLFPHFEKAGVHTALQRMEAELNSYEAAPSDANEAAYWGLAHYYCAKAYLMLEDRPNALQHLLKAKLTAHQRRYETDELIQALGSQ
ncbi:hypothetical protein HUU05_05380 [candidate division KSB1 bacterium]|nr:hypothetical protein [candidate division KSB1 bacterium]